MKMRFNLAMSILMLTASNHLTAQTAVQWSKSFGGMLNDSAYSIKQTSDGGYIVAGKSRSLNGDVSGNHGRMDYWVAKLTAEGNITWQRSYGGSAIDIAKCIVQTTDGGYIVAGITNSNDGDVTDHGQSYDDGPPVTNLPTDIYEPWIVKLTSTGDITWAKSIHETVSLGTAHYYYESIANTIIQTSDGGYLVGGYGRDYFNLPPDYPIFSYSGDMLVKLNSLGDVDWKKFYGDFAVEIGETYSQINSIVQSGAGYTTVGNGQIELFGPEDIIIRRVDLTGTSVWHTTVGSSSIDLGNCIQNTSDGGYIVAGGAAEPDGDFTGTGHHGGLWDMCLVKLTSTGDVSWARCYGGSEIDIANTVQQTADDGYIFGGSSTSNNGQVSGHSAGSSEDFWIVKALSDGSFYWGQSFGGTGTDDPVSLEKTTDGGFIVTGPSSSSDAGFVRKGNVDYWVIKFQDCKTMGYPTASSRQSFCSGATVANLVANGVVGSTISWFTSPSGGTALSSGTLLANGNYYASQSIGTCTGPRYLVSVVVNPRPSPPSATNQTFCSSINPTVFNLVVTGAVGATFKWYNLSSGGTALVSSTPLVSGNYYVSQTVGSCESLRTLVVVTVTATPPMPTAANQSFCSSNYPRVSHLVETGVAGATFKWYNVPIGGTELPASTPITSGNYYVSQTTVGGCESARRLVTVTVTVVPKPIAPASQSFCSSNYPRVSHLVETGVAGATIKWYNVSSGGTELPALTPITTSGNYYVSQTVGGCESLRTLVVVTVTATPPMPTAANQSFCSSNYPRVSHLLETGVPGATIKWYNVPSGGTELSALTPITTSGNYYVSQTVAGCESLRRLVVVTVTNCLSRPGDISPKEEPVFTRATVNPNPANNRVLVNIHTGKIGPYAQIVLVDLQGKILMQQRVANNHGHIQKTIDVSKLINGVYIVKYIIGNENGQIKLVVIK